MGLSSPMRDSPLKSNIEATGNVDASVETSKVDTPIKPVHMSNMDANVNMGEGVSNTSGQEDDDQNGDDDEFDGTFVDIEFNTEEENIQNNMFLTGKEFKILKIKLNSLLPPQVDTWRKHYVSSIEVDMLLKRQEHRCQDTIDNVDRNNEKRVKPRSDLFSSELRNLKDVTNESIILFIHDVKNVREDVNLKIQEHQEDTGKESLNPKVEKMDEDDLQKFENIKKLLVELKGLELKSSFVSSSLIILELLFENFSLLESTIQKELSPISKLINMMPTDRGAMGRKKKRWQWVKIQN
ncbi:unnamed protein product [Lactuca saligna]|uniref:Uncharacterized protein n=1 Tax=Lactuca saligna TaxID=75948 RepID=A0AA35VGE0_LACSI|nr:unnamed protein product [Lactuca saligna]